ncbi:MAG: beta-hydroxyacyl-ACP dehydratase [Opitutaceae bacterium]|jgi:3-hydroxyacyl-[acyl-carrier-protein] dehydratase|nr:beta-hydroxyacyl-ACP dehydratase [Opitutaceae bacterium]
MSATATTTVTELIPHRPPFLFVDEIVSETADSLVTRRTWRADEFFYEGHYPGAPITPGVLLCEATFQAGALYMARQALAAGVKPGEPGEGGGGGGTPLIAKIGEARFRNPVYPGDEVLIEVKKKEALGGFTMMSGSMKKADGTRVMNIEFAVAWKKPARG